MGVTVRQEEKDKGKPLWAFIAHAGKEKSIRAGTGWLPSNFRNFRNFRSGHV
jgi:hypothetical protein